MLVISALVAVLSAAFLAPSAFATKKYVQIGQFPPEYPANQNWQPTNLGELLAESVAVSDKNGHIYVADSGRGVIYDYSSSSDRQPVRWSGTDTPEGSFGEHVSVAVDNTTGDVYVACREHKVIDKFDENGNLIASFGDTTPSQNGQLKGLETPAKSFSPPASYYSSFPIAVDQATHDLYVADPGHEVIDIFDENGAYLRQITAKPTGLYGEGGEYTTGIAVTTAGNVYVSDWSAHEVFQFNSSGNFVSAWNGGNLPNGPASETPDGNFGEGGSPLEVAVEDSSTPGHGHVIVNNWGHRSVDIFDESGNFLPPQIVSTTESNGSRTLENVEGVAIDQATGYLYASSDWTGSIEIFKSITVPDVSAAPASAATTTGVTLHGHVDPAAGEGGGAITECHFEYLTVYQYAKNSETWNGATQAPCSPSPSTTATDVSATVTGLTPGTEYQFRLVAANAEGANSASGPNFVTNGHYRLSSQFGSTGTGDGQLKEPKEVAINNENGDVYVADTGNHRVDEFSSSGAFIRSFGADVGGAGVNVCTTGCQAGTAGTGAGQFTAPRFVEVDNSKGPSAGDVYVADTADSTVQKFDPSGNLISGWNGGKLEFPKKEGTIGGITVDPAGNLYVLTDNEPYNWTEISQDGVSRTQFPTNGTWEGGEKLYLAYPGGTGIDISSGEGWYETGPAQNASYGVYYSSPAAQIYNFYGMYEPLYGLPLTNSGIAINRANDDLFVSQGTHIDRFAEGECIPPGHGCRPTDSFGSGILKSAAGLAARPSTGVLYAADAGNNEIAVFSPSPAPEVTTGPATILSPTAAKITGHVDPNGPGTINECSFEYLAGDVTNELQNIAFSPGTKEGTFTATFEGQTTKPIQFAAGNFTAETFQFRLEQLSTIGAGNVRVNGEETGPFRIEFKGKFADSMFPR